MRTFRAPKSSNHKALVTGLKASPSMCGLESLIVTCLTMFPLGEIIEEHSIAGERARGIKAERWNVNVAIGTRR